MPTRHSCSPVRSLDRLAVFTACCLLVISHAVRAQERGQQPSPPRTPTAASEVQRVRPPAPQWARGVTWYQILIDRFDNADPHNDPRARELFEKPKDPWVRSEWTSDWHLLTPQEAAFTPSFYPNAFRRQYGGDLEGVRRRIPYLANLGVGAVILSPIFESRSSHKFDHASWHHVDRHFGPRIDGDTIGLATERPADPTTWYTTSADRLFYQTVADFHARGIKVVLDAQFAHVSVHFWAFRDLLRAQEKSPYVSWFTVNEWDRPETAKSEFSYRSMWGVQEFPELRTDSLGLAPGARAYLFAATRKWMDPDGNGDPSDGIDGWRLDLAGELPARFLREWIDTVKAINPNALVIGSPLEREPHEPNPFDVRKEDVFGREGTRWILNRASTPTSLDAALSNLLSEDPTGEAADRHIVRIGDHETDRIASMCVNPANPYEEQNSPLLNPAYVSRRPTHEERASQKLLLLLQFTWVGAPLVFYGDEAGMWGGDDPDCRKPMRWPGMQFLPETNTGPGVERSHSEVAFDSSVHAFYRSLIALREEHLALREGELQTTMLDDVRQLYGYMRHAGADRVQIVINASDAPQEAVIRFAGLPAGARVRAVLQQQSFFTGNGVLNLMLPPRTGVVLVPEY
jgi:cyclomaltodextrinase / maltogenic alpha-amylase / neopullulanase